MNIIPTALLCRRGFKRVFHVCCRNADVNTGQKKKSVVRDARSGSFQFMVLPLFSSSSKCTVSWKNLLTTVDTLRDEVLLGVGVFVFLLLHPHLLLANYGSLNSYTVKSISPLLHDMPSVREPNVRNYVKLLVSYLFHYIRSYLLLADARNKLPSLSILYKYQNDMQFVYVIHGHFSLAILF